MEFTAYEGESHIRDQSHSHYLYPTSQKADHILIVSLYKQAFNMYFYGIFTKSYASHVWVLYFMDHLL